jgi:hypothetical protein
VATKSHNRKKNKTKSRWFDVADITHTNDSSHSKLACFSISRFSYTLNKQQQQQKKKRRQQKSPTVVFLFHPSVFYSAGEAVKGSVVFQPKSDRRVYNIQLHFTGFEFVENSLLSDTPYQKRWILTGQTVLFGNKTAISQKEEDRLKLK